MIIFGFSAFRAERTLIKETVYLLRRPKNVYVIRKSVFYFLFVYYFYEAAKILKF